MHGSIFPYTIPQHPQGQVQSFGLGGGDFFKAVLFRGRKRDKSKLASPCLYKVRYYY